MGVGLEGSVHPTDRLTITPASRFFWRADRADGIYNPPGRPFRGAAGGDRFVGVELNVLATQRLTARSTLSLEAAWFFAGGYLDDNPPAEDIGFVLAQLEFRF